MKQIIKHEQCLRCRECCRFRADRLYFAPLFTQDEIESIRQTGADMPEFVPFQGSDKVFQIKLQPAQIKDPVYEYVCPFLDEANYVCTIYEQRPFDCQVWPFIVMREAGRKILAHFTGESCLALDEVDAADFAEYRDYFAALIRSEKYRDMLTRFPELVWEHQSDENYPTVPVLDITDDLDETRDVS